MNKNPFGVGTLSGRGAAQPTRHGQRRQADRCVPQFIIDALIDFGEERFLRAIIGIWLATARPEKALTFDARATIGPCPSADAESDEFDIVLEVRQLSVNAAKPP